MDLNQLISLKKEGYSNLERADILLVSRIADNEYVQIFSSHGLIFEEFMELDNQRLHDFLTAY